MTFADLGAGNAGLVAISAADGAQAELARTDDPDPGSAPRTGHARAGDLIVLESNRALDRDRLLRIAPR